MILTADLECPDYRAKIQKVLDSGTRLVSAYFVYRKAGALAEEWEISALVSGAAEGENSGSRLSKRRLVGPNDLAEGNILTLADEFAFESLLFFLFYL